MKAFFSTLVVLLTCFLSMHFFRITLASAESSRKSPRIRLILSLLEKYKSVHGLDTIRSEPPEIVCRRKFMRFYSFDCKLAGNFIGAVLTDLITSIIFNRTILIHEPECYGAIVPREWVVTIDTMKNILDSAGCSNDLNYVQIHPKKFVNSTITVLNYPNMYNEAYDIFHPSLSTIPLTIEQKKITEILFSHPIDDISRFESYCLAFMKLVQFTNITRTLVEPILNDVFSFGSNDYLENLSEDHESIHQNQLLLHHKKSHKNVIVIGVHLRHYDGDSHERPGIDANFDRVALEAIDQMYTNIFNNSRNAPVSVKGTPHCILLVAADRAHSLRAVLHHAAKINCEARHLPKNMSAEPSHKYTDDRYIEMGKRHLSCP